MTVDVTVTRVLDTLHVLEVAIPFPMKTVTITVDTAHPVTLIDTGIHTPEARAGLEAGLAQLGLKFSDVQRVIVTHHHPDHYGMAGVLEEAGAEIFVLDIEAQYGLAYWRDWNEWLPKLLSQMHENGLPLDMHDAQDRFHRFVRGMVVPAQKWTLLKENDVVQLVGRDWRVLWLPGHADGHLALWQPEESLIIAADAILPRITPNVGLYAYSRPDPLRDYLFTLDRLAELAPGRAIVGHHGPVMLDVVGRVQVLKAHHAERLEFLKKAASESPGSAWELSRVMFPKPLNEANLRFALAETLAHLEHLHLRGELEKTQQNDVFVYSA